MTTTKTHEADPNLPIRHSAAYRRRRFLNWFPLGLTYAFLYMARYNLTVAKTSLGNLMTKEDFGLIFAVGTVVYGFAFVLNGPLTDKLGGKRAILAAALGAALSNLAMGIYLRQLLVHPDAPHVGLTTAMTALYAVNMYFQSFGAVAIVKINAHWFHVRERGGFSGIFGTMISSGIFLAFTVNAMLLDLVKGSGPGGIDAKWWVFLAPALALLTMFAIELVLLKDRPGQAGHEDFDTGDTDLGAGDIPALQLMKRILTNPIILTVAGVEFCTGVLRNGVMHWFPIYVNEVWALAPSHVLRNGPMTIWSIWGYIGAGLAVGALFWAPAAKLSGRPRGLLVVLGAAAVLAPFLLGGWGGLLFVAGVVGGNLAGWMSDLFFQSRRAPVAGGLYLVAAVGVGAMILALGGTTSRVGWADARKSPLRVGDEVVAVAGVTDIHSWADVARAVACVPSRCRGENVRWDTAQCMCTASPHATREGLATSTGALAITVLRAGRRVELAWRDRYAEARAGDRRILPAGPALTLSPFVLGALVVLISVAVIGVHGVLSGTATMDFGGKKGAATAVGVIDGFVYLGTALQSLSLGYITTRNWAYWPVFLLPFAVLGFALLTRIWHAMPRGRSSGH